MRLTYNAINNAPTVINPEGKLVLQMRGMDIAFVENLSCTQDRFEVIDFTNNLLVELANIPEGFRNLEVLLLANNSISRVEGIPNDNSIRSITMAHNNLSSIEHIWRNFGSLENLILEGNPVTEREHYREFMAWLLPSLRALDYARITDAERKKGEEIFGTDRDDWNEHAMVFAGKGEKEEIKVKENKVNLGDEERKELMERLQNASSMDEITSIEERLKR